MAKRKPFDLSSITNPSGRVDVFAASVLDKLAERNPELLPFLSANREVIHKGLREQLGPRVVNLRSTIKMAEPFMPLIDMAIGKIAEKIAPRVRPAAPPPPPPTAKPLPNYYETLGVPATASMDEIRHAYLKLARKHHPDLNPGSKNAEERFKEAQAAYDVVGDEGKRVAYDRYVSGRGRAA